MSRGPSRSRPAPDYVALVVLTSGLTNGSSDDGSDAQLAAAEALLRDSGLALKSQALPGVNALLDLYNAVSVRPDDLRLGRLSQERLPTMRRRRPHLRWLLAPPAPHRAALGGPPAALPGPTT